MSTIIITIKVVNELCFVSSSFKTSPYILTPKKQFIHFKVGIYAEKALPAAPL